MSDDLEDETAEVDARKLLDISKNLKKSGYEPLTAKEIHQALGGSVDSRRIARVIQKVKELKEKGE